MPRRYSGSSRTSGHGAMDGERCWAGHHGQESPVGVVKESEWFGDPLVTSLLSCQVTSSST